MAQRKVIDPKPIQLEYSEEAAHDVLTGRVNGIKVTCSFSKDPGRHDHAMRGLKKFILTA